MPPVDDQIMSQMFYEIQSRQSHRSGCAQGPMMPVAKALYTRFIHQENMSVQ